MRLLFLLCPEEYNKLIKEKNMCIDDCQKDDIYKYEYNNICYKNYPIETITNEINDQTSDPKIKENDFTNNIKIATNINQIKDKIDTEIEKFKEMISSFDVSEKTGDIIKREENVQCQITTSDNQKNNSNKNISTIDLGICEEELKKRYNIDPSLPLIIFKVDYFSPEISIPIIGYEIYHPITKELLNLSYCGDNFIKLNIPVDIDENSLYKYDPNSEFYQDNCFAYTTVNGTDIILDDRKKEFNDNKLSLCENNCNFTGYEKDNKQSSCNCNIKNKMDTISELMENSDTLLNNFDSDESSISSGSSNIISIKCTKALFSKDGLKNNISSYILIIFLTYFLLSIVLFIKCGYPLLVNDINNILHEKQKIEKQNHKKIRNIIEERNCNKRNKNKVQKNNKKKKTNYPPKKAKINFFNNMNMPKKGNNMNSVLNLRKSNLSKKNLTKSKQTLNTGNKKGQIPLTNKNKSIKILYNDYELNTMDYKKAISNDERSFLNYYLALLKSKNAIIFSFCPRNDYNSIIIRSDIFCLSFSIYYATNFAFFTDEILHKIYEDGGKYDILYFINDIIISFFVSYFITILLKIIFLSERNINEVRKQALLSMSYNIADKEKKNMVIKYIIFFILGLAFLVFFWMLLSSFGAVYPNTQMFIFKNALISFAMSLVFPFVFNVFPSLLRIYSLKSNNSECLYKVSKFLQIV